MTGSLSMAQLAGRIEAGSGRWCAVQYWLGQAAHVSADLPGALGHLTAVRDAAGDRGPSRMLADALAYRSVVLLNMGRLAEGTEDGRRSLTMARELCYLVGEAMALHELAIAAYYGGDNDGTVQLIRQKQSLAELLEEDEQRVFRHLSVFPGSRSSGY